MKKRNIVICVIAVIAVVFLSVSLSSRRKISKSNYYKPITSHYNYDVLPDKQSKEIYNEMKKTVFSSPKKDEKGDFCFSEIIVNKDITDTQIFLARKAFLSDNPDVFWLSGWKMTEHSERNHIIFFSLYSPEKLKTMTEEYEEAIKECLSKVEKDLSFEELELYAHDYLINNCKYDDNALDDDGNQKEDYSKRNEVNSSYGALVNGSALCGGYSKAYQLLLNRLGVDCVTVIGKGNSLDSEVLRFRAGGVDHAWNAVKNGSTWLMTDVTWDDSENQQDQHKFFNLSISEMYKTHQAQKLDAGRFSFSPIFHSYDQDDNLFLPQ